jgi:hypothetical protein
MAKRTFDEWVDGIFDHPVTEPAWYWAVDADTCEEDDATNAEYLTRLFSNSDRALERFDDAQAGQGLWMIASPPCSNHARSITDGHASWPVRRAAIRSIYDLYAKCFGKRCTETLGHLSPTKPLNSICYMWWDVFPAWSDPKDESRFAEADEYISVMQRCLSLSHSACLEGALHGLGHWQLLFPDRIGDIVDQFLRERTDLRHELMLYARRARIGAVQ